MGFDIIIVAIVLLWIAASVAYLIKRKKSGKYISCGGNCSRCAGCSQCDKNNENK